MHERGEGPAVGLPSPARPLALLTPFQLWFEHIKLGHEPDK
jgi:hypothetical protein